MRLIIAILSLLLGVSVCLNIYYYFLIKPLPNSAEKQPSVRLEPSPAKSIIQDTKQPTWFVSAQRAFDTHQFDIATRLTESIDRDNPDKLALLETWYQRAASWLTENDYDTFVAFEQHFLKYYPNDIQVLLLSAQKELNANSINAGISAYYELLDLPMSHKKRDEIYTQLEHIISQHIDSLKRAQAWQVLQGLSETLLNFEPDNVNFIFTLAESYARQQDSALTEFAIGLLPFSALSDSRVSDIRGLLRDDELQAGAGNDDLSINDTETNEHVSVVTLTRTGEHYIVSTQFNERHTIDLLIDTGASTTTLSQSVFARYFGPQNSRYLGQYTLNTANGLTQAPVYQVKHVSIGQYVLNNVAVVVLPLEHMRDAEGLLGMNVLRAFDFRIDQSKAQLRLSPR